MIILPIILACSCSVSTDIVSGSATLAVDTETGVATLCMDGCKIAVSASLAKALPAGLTGAAVEASTRKSVRDNFGKGKAVTLKSEDGSLFRELTLTAYKDFPDVIFLSASFTNVSPDTVVVEGWELASFDLSSNGDKPAFWSFQGESTIGRGDWIKPVDKGFFQENYMGMNNEDYGGGTPVTCLWTSKVGIAVAHVQPNPERVSLPVDMTEDKTVRTGISKRFDKPITLAPQESMECLKTYVSVYHGDCFSPLRQYSEIMARQGIVPAESPEVAYEPAWCAWGYGRNFTLKEVLGTLDKVKELGIKWATIDDGYQIAEGDWDIDIDRFPGGDDDMRRLVDAIHEAGMKAELWWTPLCADPGSDFLEQHPNTPILSEEGSPYVISWWDSWFLSPIDKDVLDETRRLVTKFIGDYDFDGLKLDGQHMNAVPLDHNPAHTPDDPERGFRELPSFYKLIYDTARSIKPEAVLQFCPCGDNFAFHILPYINKTVASDPEDSYQVRTKGYVLRALAPKTAYYGDHVELSDEAEDFPSQLGIGAVLGTKFTWPADNPYLGEKNLLTLQREATWKHAFSIYNEKKLSKGEYVFGLYDIGYDHPETHLISKDGMLYYAFYTDVPVKSIELRGLEEGRTYHIVDYYNDMDLGTVVGSTSVTLPADFCRFLLLEARPE